MDSSCDGTGTMLPKVSVPCTIAFILFLALPFQLYIHLSLLTYVMCKTTMQRVGNSHIFLLLFHFPNGTGAIWSQELNSHLRDKSPSSRAKAVACQGAHYKVFESGVEPGLKPTHSGMRCRHPFGYFNCCVSHPLTPPSVFSHLN